MTATLFAANGSLYATFDTDIIEPVSGNITFGILNSLYRIDPNTAVITTVAPTTQATTAATQVNGTSYAFNVGTQQLLSLKSGKRRNQFRCRRQPGARVRRRSNTNP